MGWARAQHGSPGSTARVHPCCWQLESPLIPVGSARAALCSHLAEGDSSVTKPFACDSPFPGVLHLTGVFLPSPGTAGLQGSRWELRAQFPGKCSEICLCCSPKAFGRFQPEELLLQEAAWLVLSLGMGKEPLSSRKGLSSPLFPPDRLSSVMARGRAS